MKYLSIPFILAGILGILRQGIVANQWWKWGDLLTLPTTVYPYWHHEPLIVGCFVVGIALIIGGRK